MRTRYLTNIVLALLGGFLVVVSQAFSASTLTWLMLGVGALALAISVPGLPIRSRGLPQRGMDVIVSVLGAWTIIAGLVFAGAAVTWLGFASGIAIVAMAVIGLTAHELSTERVVHSFEVGSGAGDRERERERIVAGVH